MNLQFFVPSAKGFGMLLNFNQSLLLLPVLRNFLQVLNNARIGSKMAIARYFPLQKNIIFHKLIAKVMCFSAACHVIAHFLNFAQSSTATINKFGFSPFITGAIITTSMFFIF